jgi:hypothetical protein
MSGSAGTFTFSCGTLPANSSCTFNPTSESVAANATGSVTVKIATGNSSTSAQNSNHGQGRFSSRECMIAVGLFMFPFAFVRRQRGAFLVVTLIFCIFTCAGCASAGGSGSSAPPSNPANGNTPAGTYSIDVNATSNGLSHKTTLTLTVD